MPDASSQPSFSVGRKLRIIAQVGLTVLLVAAVVTMVNYLSGHYFLRFQLSAQTRTDLSPRTLSLVKSLTNRVDVTMFYDREDPLYSTVSALLDEYHRQNPKITVNTVDYTRDAVEAQAVKMKYNLPSSLVEPHEKNWVIFDCEGRVKIFPGNGLATYSYKQLPSTNKLEMNIDRKLAGFNGEMMFSAALLALNNPKPVNAYFLVGHGEANPVDDKDDTGYNKFAVLVKQNYVEPRLLSLSGTNTVPADCGLLVIPAPVDPIPSDELAKINQYLSEGGRLFAMFNVRSIGHPTGLEKLLAGWGVRVGDYVVRDTKNSLSSEGWDVLVKNFAKQPVVDSLIGSQLQLIYPRAVFAIDTNLQVADAPKVQEIAFTGPQSFEVDSPDVTLKTFPLMVAVEKSAPSGVVTERGSTRLIVVGDSLFLDNQFIDIAPAQRDFATYVINWLLDRPAMLQGLGPRPVSEYRVVVGKTEMIALEWILLAAMPGAMLAIGGLVWLRRRK